DGGRGCGRCRARQRGRQPRVPGQACDPRRGAYRQHARRDRTRAPAGPLRRGRDRPADPLRVRGRRTAGRPVDARVLHRRRGRTRRPCPLRRGRPVQRAVPVAARLHRPLAERGRSHRRGRPRDVGAGPQRRHDRAAACTRHPRPPHRRAAARDRRPVRRPGGPQPGHGSADRPRRRPSGAVRPAGDPGYPARPPAGGEVMIAHIDSFAELPDGRIHYRNLGETGPPVVLLHGGGIDNGDWIWRWLAHDLATDHRVHVLDQPKHGQSWPWYARADQRGQETMLAGMLDHWNLETATLIGLSLGAATALGYTLRHPERVSRLVLTSSGGIQDRVQSHEIAWLSLRTPFSWLIGRSMTAASMRRWVRRHVAFADYVPTADIEALADLAAQELLTKRAHGGHMFCDWNRDETAPR